MGGFDEIPFWRRDQEDICSRVRARPATLKIIVKTKDEKHFLADWVSHHSAIVGLENLIIFDNMSTDESVCASYEKFPKEIQLVRYDGFHNNIHNKDIFPGLYAALADSCRYFLFIDTDEFLTYIGDDKIVSPQSTVQFLTAGGEVDIYPGTWLYNAPQSRSLFRCGSVGELDGGLRWGKPIVRAQAKTSGTLLHNSELPASMYNSSAPLCFYILHMLNLYPDQRIAVNLRKLVARGLIAPTDSVESVLARDWTNIEDNIVRVYVSEIRDLSNGGSSNQPTESKGLIRIESGARVGFPSAYEEAVFEMFRSNGTNGAIKRLLMAGNGSGQ